MSLISTYQSRKSLFAEKLEDKGVEASATDGLTTLINKIDDIEGGFTEGLLLYAENNIVQKEDTVDLYALLLQDGKPVPNKTVEFVGLWSIVAGRISHVPPHYKITNVYDSSGIAYLDADHHFKIEGSRFYKDDVQQSATTIYTVEMNQNNLTVTYLGGTTSTFDVSNYDMSVIETNKNMLEIIFYASGTTGSDGVASYTYTGVGEGLKEVYAKYGTLVSEIYAITDYNKLDTGIQGTASNIWNNVNYFDRQTDGTVFTNPSATGWTSVYFQPNNSAYIPLTDGLTFEFELVDCTVTQADQFRVRFIDGGTNPYYILTETGKYKFVLSDKLYGYKDGVPLGDGVTYDTSISTIQIGIVDTSASASVKFKNFGYY